MAALAELRDNFKQEKNLLSSVAQTLTTFAQSEGQTTDLLSNVVLMGEPGIGKTTIAKQLAKVYEQILGFEGDEFYVKA